MNNLVLLCAMNEPPSNKIVVAKTMMDALRAFIIDLLIEMR